MSEKLPTMPKECIEAFKQISMIGAAKGYSPTSWRGESPQRHISKTLGHIAKWMDIVDKTGSITAKGEEDHLLHAMWRLCAAVSQIMTIRDYECLSSLGYTSE